MTDKKMVISDENRARLAQLAAKVFNKDINEVTNKECNFVMQADMKMSFSDLTISASATRPSEVKYATNNYHISTKIDISGITKVVFSELETLPEEEIVDKYFALKQAAYKLIESKAESVENYLRNILLTFEEKDSCPKVGRFNKE